MATYEFLSLDDYIKNLHKKMFDSEFKKICENILSIKTHIDWKFLFTYTQFIEPLDKKYFWQKIFPNSKIEKEFSILKTDTFTLKIPHYSNKNPRKDPSPLLCYFENCISEAEWTFKR